ncbi:D-alanyl-D-alanine carboxypeptidase family protein [Chitinivorax sp. PXF-14]|uniref:D-alanyl-D-alanine carboxypeptidase family protein n=1 Tax=Chitinivorax sp. PXF-14 TaxID=3230488 RepID=UPI00346567C6
MTSLKRIFAALACLAASATATATANTLLTPPVPEIAARAYLLTDYYSGQTLAQRDENMRVEPASLTKLMTAYVTFKAVKQGRIKLDQVVPVSSNAYKKEGSVMFIDPKIPVTVDELIHGMIIQSGNDACIALAEAIAGSEAVFAQMMNQEAARLGMKNTHFVNSTGLPDPQHYTTAHDLALIAAALVRDFPEFYPIYSQKEFTYNKIKQPNRNLLLYRDPNVDGMKTGHTESAGFCLIASSKRDGRRVISVVLGTTGDNVRATESSKLLNWGLQFYDTPKLYSANQSLQQVPVWKGAEREIKVGFRNDLYLSLPKGTASRIKASLTTQQPLLAPVAAGQRVGKLTLTLDGQPLGEYPVVALNNVAQAGIFGRAWDSVRLMFNK